MDPQYRAEIIQKLILVIKNIKLPAWYLAEKIVKEVIEPELQKVKDRYERLFFNNDKH